MAKPRGSSLGKRTSGAGLDDRNHEAHTEERHSDPACPGQMPTATRPEHPRTSQRLEPAGPELHIGFHGASLPTTQCAPYARGRGAEPSNAATDLSSARS